MAAAASLATAQWASGTPAGKGSNPLARFTQVAERTVSADNFLGTNPDRQITVMVQASGRPIALVQAHAGHKLSLGRWNSVRSDLRGEQGHIAAAVHALGGKVGNSYQAAYNGMKVTIAAGKIGALSNIPNVVGVHALVPKTVSNVHGVPLIGAPQVWAGLNGFHGEGEKIAVIDTGIDYTHADFGGPGTTAAYQAALATDTASADPALFGPAAPRVKGGYDFVGDDYNANPKDTAHYQPVPHPDPNPLDCNGHGTHTAGTAAGSGVLADGNTYAGAYNANTIAANTWNVGPGVAPKSDIYSLRVFGCAGSSDVVVDAIEWAMDNHMDVINMSLGSPFGGSDDPDAVASNNAAAAGTIVVTSAGNEGPNPYMTGTPGTANAVISTAANDPTSGFAGVDIGLSTGTHVQAINANGISVNGLTAPIKVLYTGTPHDAAHISLGCDPNEYLAANVTGDIVVVKRGTCARVARAIFGQKAGAVAVVMVNNVDSLPPFEGHITKNPDPGGEEFDVTIPFLGVKSSSGDAIVAADGGTTTLTDNVIPNPSFLATASFSSGGPRSGDSALKPDLTAPGVSIASAGMGTGNQPSVLSGTSMASPHVAGAAALVRQAHPSWGAVKYWKAALVNTADPAMVADYSTRRNGNGFVRVKKAVDTDVVATSVNDTATISYGFAEVGGTYKQRRTVRLRNFGNTAATFVIAHAQDAGSPHTVTASARTIRVPANGTASFYVTLQMPGKTVGDSSAFRDVSGRITLTPSGGSNHGVSLALAYYMVPRATSKIHTSLNMTTLKNHNVATATTKNFAGAIAGNADWYALGTTDGKEALGPNDIKAVGVQTFPDDNALVFGLNTWNRWSAPSAIEFDIFVDVNGDHFPDYDVIEADIGLITADEPDGRPGVFVVDLRTHEADLQLLADAPTDSTTMGIPVLFGQLCNEGSPCIDDNDGRITYSAAGFFNGEGDLPDSEATFNVLNPSIDTGMFDTVAPYHQATETVHLDPAEFSETPPLGVMVLSHDNMASTEAQLIPFP